MNNFSLLAAAQEDIDLIPKGHLGLECKDGFKVFLWRNKGNFVPEQANYKY